MGIGLWALALTLVLAGLTSALRYKLVLSVLLLSGGMALGLWASDLLP
jgi:hypothetical protein